MQGEKHMTLQERGVGVIKNTEREGTDRLLEYFNHIVLSFFL